jgi:hypothetical protein
VTTATAFLQSNGDVCGSPGGLAQLLASGTGKWRRDASGVVTLWRARGVRRARSGACVHVTGTSGRVAFWRVQCKVWSSLVSRLLRGERGVCQTWWCRLERKGEGDGTGWPCHATAWSCPCQCEPVEVMASGGTGAGRWRGLPEHQRRARVDLVSSNFQHGHDFHLCPEGV